MNTDNEFDKIINRMTGNPPMQVKRQSKSGALFGVIMGASIISAIGGTILMFMNNIVAGAFPNADWLQPGIGFIDAYKFFFLFLVLKTIFVSLSNVQKNS
tara:strand:+ start:326 stop:625 length:300 start_codon:yes stop_codon:yes gene_type:complete